MSQQPAFCCEEMRKSLSMERSLLFYHPVFEEYGIPFSTAEGFSYMTIGYCPWCGKALPLSKREQWLKARQDSHGEVRQEPAE